MRRFPTSALLILTLLATQAFGSPTLEIDRTTARPGQLVTVTLRDPSNGASYWVGLYEKTAMDHPSAERISYQNLGSSNNSVGFLMPIAQGDYHFRLYDNASSLRITTSAHIAVECPPVTLTTNTVHTNAGRTITVQVIDGPNNPGDYIRMNRSDAPDTQSITHKYLNGQTSATFIAPSESGEYNFRLFAHNSHQRIARTVPVVVKNTIQLVVNPATPSPGQAVTVTVVGGPNNPTDYIRMCPLGAPPGAYCMDVRYLTNGPSISFIAPSAPATYEFRLFVDNTHQLLATQTFNVQGSVQLVVNPATPSPGQVVTVAVVGGPNNPTDYIRMCPSDAPPGAYCMDVRYLTNGPSISFIAPSVPATYEFRLFVDNTHQLLATQTFNVQNSGP